LSRRNRSRFRTLLVGVGSFALVALLLATRLMWMHKADVSDIPEAEQRYLRAALQAANVARGFLEWMDGAIERLSPERSAALAEEARRLHAGALRGARTALDASPPPTDLAPFATRLDAGFADVEQSFSHFVSQPDASPMHRIGDILSAMHHVARAQETFYTLRRALSPFAAYWVLPGVQVEDPPVPTGGNAPPTGVMHVAAGGHHGGFAVYVPETYTTERTWPVIIALHGGSGNGDDFLWTWVREAKSFGYLLVAPTAVRDTWSEVDDVGLLEILSWLGRRYRVDNHRVLLTGLSDGGTYTLLYGLAHPDVYRALAPLCGVLHPANEALGNLGRARSVPIYLVHGAQDFLFPVALARLARDTLLNAGAALEYRELPELSHTYPRSQNVRILRWFEALPPR
jgi:phospholipase/carboxylesterase